MPDEQAMLMQTLEQEHKRLQQALRESEILRELSALLASSLDLSHVLQKLVQHTVEICQVERCTVWLHDESKGYFIPKVHYLGTDRLQQDAVEKGIHTWQRSSLSLDEPLIRRLFEAKGLLVVENLHDIPGMQNVAEQFFVRSILLITLQREGRILGMMSLDNPGLSSTFSQEQQQLGRAIGQQAAVAIDNAQLYQQANNEKKRAERLIGRAQAIFEVAMAMNSDEELSTILGIATKHLVSGLEASGGAIALLDNNALILASMSNLRAYAPTLSPPLTQLHQCNRAKDDDSPRFVMSEEIEGAERSWYQQLGMTNVLIVPLIAGPQYRSVFDRKRSVASEGRQCVGFAFVNYPKGHQFPTGGQLAFAMDIAAQCALAIDKNAMFTRIRNTAALATERANTMDAIFDAMTEGILVVSMDGEIVISNNAASRFIGMPLYARKPLELFLRANPAYTLYGQPIDVEDFPLTRALRGEHIRGERFIAKRVDHDERILEVNISPLLNDENKQIAIVGAFRDVTEQVHAERRMRGALDLLLNAAEAISGVNDVQELLRRILTMTAHELHCGHGVVFTHDEEQQVFAPLVSLDGTLEYDSNMLDVHTLFAQDMSHASEQEPFSSLYAGNATVWATKSASYHYPEYSRGNTGTSTLLLAPLTHNNHLLGIMALKQQPSTDENKPIRSFTMWDIAVVEGIGQFAGLAIEQVRWQSEAENARTREEAMRQANELKDQFLSITAHEFRTPLTVILTHSQLVARLLRKAKDVPQLNRLLDGLKSIEEQTHQLTNIVNTFLEVTRINKGQVSLSLEQVDLAALAKQVVSDQEATTKHHTISYHTESTEQSYIAMGDSTRLSQVLTNLIQNAIKYSPSGSPIMISLCQNLDKQQHRYAEIRVKDKGIGVPKDAQQHLFECFYRAPNAQTSEVRGVGLGLFVVAEFLRLHNGSIHVESSGEYGEGSTFVVKLPLLESDELSA